MGRDDRDDDRRSHYGINSNILVAAIVFLSIAVIIVITLHIYARWVLRRQARRQAALTRLAIIITNSTTNDTTAAAAAEPPKTSLDPAAIAAMPSFLFKRADDSTEHAECSVCLSSLEDGEKARTLPNCGHTFHADCVDKWFGSNSTCPVCRAEALPRLVQEPREAVPTAPPLEGTSCQDGSGRIQCSAKIGSSGSGSMLSSFRRMIVGERSSRRMRVPSCGMEEGLAAGDLERQ